MAEFHDIVEARNRRRGLPPGGDGGHNGGMPPSDISDLKDRATRLEVKVDALLPAVEAIGSKIDGLTDRISGLTERVAAVEGQLKHIPTLWSVLVGQVVAAIAVAGIIITAFTFGVTISAPKVPAAAVGPNPAHVTPTQTAPTFQKFKPEPQGNDGSSLNVRDPGDAPQQK